VHEGGMGAGQVFALRDVMVFVVLLLSVLWGGSKELGITNIVHIAHMSFKSSWVSYLGGGRTMERREAACVVWFGLLFDDGWVLVS